MNTRLSPKQLDTMRAIDAGALSLRNGPPQYMLGLMHRKLVVINVAMQRYELTLKGRLTMSLYEVLPFCVGPEKGAFPYLPPRAANRP